LGKGDIFYPGKGKNPHSLPFFRMAVQKPNAVVEQKLIGRTGGGLCSLSLVSPVVKSKGRFSRRPSIMASQISGETTAGHHDEVFDPFCFALPAASGGVSRRCYIAYEV
jgi:hypothetical protein